MSESEILKLLHGGWLNENKTSFLFVCVAENEWCELQTKKVKEATIKHKFKYVEKNRAPYLLIEDGDTQALLEARLVIYGQKLIELDFGNLKMTLKR